MASPAGSECPVCKEEHSTPKFLPCAHVICRRCLLSWLQKDRQKSCPICRHPVSSSHDLDLDNLEPIVDRLPDDYGIVAVRQGQRILQIPQLCDMCEGEEDDDGDRNEATTFCFACSLRLCPPCSKLHAKFSKQHPTEPLTALTVQRLALESQVTCRQHSDRPAELYCPAHQEVMCALCVPLHSGCGGEMHIVSEVAKAERQELTDQGSRLLDSGARMSAKVKQLEQTLQQGEHDFRAASQTINEQFDDLQRTLDKRRQRQLDLVHEQQDGFLEAVTSQLSPLKELSPVVISHGHAAQRLAVNTPDANLLTMLSKLKPRLHQMEARSAEMELSANRSEPRSAQTNPFLNRAESTSNPMKSSNSQWESTNQLTKAYLNQLQITPNKTKHPVNEEEIQSTQTCSDIQHNSEGEDVQNRQPPTGIFSPTEMGAPSRNDPTEPPAKHDDTEVMSQQASANLKCSAEDLILDAEMVEKLKRAISNVSFKSGVCADELEPDFIFQAQMPSKQSVKFQNGNSTTDESCTPVEDNALNDDLENRKTSTAVSSPILIPGASHKGEEIGDSVPDGVVQRISSYVPSPSETSDRALSDVSKDDMTPSACVLSQSSDQEPKVNPLAAMSRQIASFVKQHFDKTDKAKPSKPKDSLSKLSPPLSEDETNPDAFKTDKSARDSSTAPMKNRFSDRSISAEGESSPSPLQDKKGLPKRPRMLPLVESHVGSRDSEEEGDGPTGWQQRSCEATVNNWRNDSLEAAVSANQRPRSKSLSDARPATPAKTRGGDSVGRAQVNTGFAVLSSPTSEMGRVVSVGSRVMRGRDWSSFCDNVDGGAGRSGTVLRKGSGDHSFGRGWVLVYWNATGRRKWHRMGAESCFDVVLL